MRSESRSESRGAPTIESELREISTKVEECPDGENKNFVKQSNEIDRKLEVGYNGEERSGEAGSSTDLPGADEFLPMMILALKEVNLFAFLF